jgi:hypothetical protein
LIFAPDGIETFARAWKRYLEVDGLLDCHLNDSIASKRAAGRAKDIESLPRPIEFREDSERRSKR